MLNKMMKIKKKVIFFFGEIENFEKDDDKKLKNKIILEDLFAGYHLTRRI